MVDIADRAEAPTIGEQLDKAGVSRRDFIEFCTKLMIAAPVGLAITKSAWAGEVAAEVAQLKRPSVVWLEFQDCTGCTETLLRTSRPSVDELIFNVISLDYHETLMPGAGKQAEHALRTAVEGKYGKFFLVCEGSIPTKDNGDFLKIAGRKGVDVLQEIGSQAAAIIAMGSCASWGGIPSAGDNPTGAVGVSELVRGVPIVNIPGCPPNPYTLIGTILEIMRTGAPPQLDAELRPKFAYDRVMKEALLIGVVGDSFDVTTELGPHVAPALPRVLEMVADVVRRNGAKAARRAKPLPSRQWWESEQPA